MNEEKLPPDESPTPTATPQPGPAPGSPPDLSLWELMRASCTPTEKDDTSSRVLTNIRPSIWDIA